MSQCLVYLSVEYSQRTEKLGVTFSGQARWNTLLGKSKEVQSKIETLQQPGP